ncbi:tRNA lysidine(34) synthetase TilS [Bacillus suaedaesalsae]|uniref:tRNA(Ile)-lysidine synthase n=1 Tax=Bacillus suaedaesalsae TaxID=2810349 RepID=A0ABS2DCB5_9BACI|nr:tRNA lysidine(34) synthetase TilS [Bacillus suaedaesalsae]MBM6616089.1 tRNA lysidine(34) synthetase TilS [Bacillus suaedaesalsae]
MIEKVKNFIRKHQLLPSDVTIVVGVSGGPDSLALLHFLHSIKEREGWHIVAAHVDHMFRGRQSEAEMNFVKNYCNQHQIPCEATQINVTEYQVNKNLSSQVAARECRYLFFAEVLKKYDASYLALAQHGDDQVETILMRLLRGATGKSVAGIQAKRSFENGYVIRPFLSVTKQEILHYCEVNHLEPRFDPSNEKETYTRNRIRKVLLPFLKSENPNVHTLFQQFSERQLEDQAYLEELTIKSMNTVIKRKSAMELIISIPDFCNQPIPLQRRGLQLILNYLYNVLPNSLSSLHIEQIFHLITSGHPSGYLTFPKGLIVKRSYDFCMFTFQEEKVNTYSYFLHKEDKVLLPNGDEMLAVETTEYPKELNLNMFIVNPLEIEFPLLVRSRRQGDKIQLKGMNGSRKLKDIFIDAKIPIHNRDSWPVVEDSEGRVLWLPGLKKSRFETPENTQLSYIVLQYKRR